MQYAPWLEIPWLRHGSTTRQFNPEEMPRIAEFRRLQEHLGIADMPMAHCQQKHTSHVELIDHDDRRPPNPFPFASDVMAQLEREGEHLFPFTDAVVCTLPGVSIGVVTADCAPILMIDTSTRIIAAAHSGWRGTIGRIAEKTLMTMVASGADLPSIQAWIGPMIGGCCYEVSEELIYDFTDEFHDAREAGVHFTSGRNLDLVALNRFQLEKAGVTRVVSSDVCTQHNVNRFHSYRVHGDAAGRILSILAVVK